MKKLLFAIIMPFLCYADMSDKNRDIYEIIWYLYQENQVDKAYKLCTTMIDNPNTSITDLMHFYMARSNLGSDSFQREVDWKCVEFLADKFPEGWSEYWVVFHKNEKFKFKT